MHAGVLIGYRKYLGARCYLFIRLTTISFPGELKLYLFRRFIAFVFDANPRTLRDANAFARDLNNKLLAAFEPVRKASDLADKRPCRIGFSDVPFLCHICVLRRRSDNC